MWSASADCRNDVHTRLFRNGRFEFRALAVDVHVNVTAERRSGLAQTVANPRPPGLGVVDHVGAGGRLPVELSRQPREEWTQRRRKTDVCHYSIAATSTE